MSKRISRDELEQNRPSAITREPGAYGLGLIVGAACCILGAIWWPLAIVAAALAWSVCIHASRVKEATAYYAVEDRRAYQNPDYEEGDSVF